MTEETKGYVAGLLEGEGCFAMCNGKPLLAVSMCDVEPLNVLASVLACNVHGPISRNCERHKPFYRIGIRARKKLQQLVDDIYHLMSPRRQEALDIWRTYWLEHPPIRYKN